MPSVSSRQQKLFAIALAIKRKRLSPAYSKKAARLARTMTEEQLRDFARAPLKKRK